MNPTTDSPLRSLAAAVLKSAIDDLYIGPVVGSTILHDTILWIFAGTGRSGSPGSLDWWCGLVDLSPGAFRIRTYHLAPDVIKLYIEGVMEGLNPDWRKELNERETKRANTRPLPQPAGGRGRLLDSQSTNIGGDSFGNGNPTTTFGS